MDIPPELVFAHADGDVVFFVGAGASMASPTNLPNFTELVKRVAQRTGAEEPTKRALKAPDVCLGRLVRPGVDVHGLVAQEIRGRHRNALHDAIATLAAAPGTPRIVTTNYDNHLHSSLRAIGAKHSVFEAPAMPAGGDFEGLVHLHGRLGQPPRRLIVTDADFGRAYVTQGWAPAFLREVFAEFVVLFVGYSHDDRMMEYLAKGLSSKTRERYILIDRDKAKKWAGLGIRPILYTRDQHSMVTATLERWGAWARDTPFDRAQRIRRLAGETPPADPDEDDFLVVSLDDERLAKEVCAVAKGDEWIDWMARQLPFKKLAGTEDAAVDDRVLSHVANWAAQAGVGTEAFRHLDQALRDTPGPVHPMFVSAVLRRITFEQVDDEQRSHWLRWVLDYAVGQHGAELQWLWGSEVNLTWPDTMLLLNHLANQWRPSTGSGFWALRSPRLASGGGLEAGMRRLLAVPSQPDKSRELLSWLTAYLEQAHRRVTSAGRSFDPWSYARSSIAPHEQDRRAPSEPEQVLVDLGRDGLAQIGAVAPELADAVRGLWFDSPAPLLRRLAIDNLWKAAEPPAGVKVSFVLARRMLFDNEVRHEVYGLLASAVPDLPGDEFDDLVQAASVGPELSAVRHDDPTVAVRYRDRAAFELLHWLVKYRPGAAAPPALAEIERRFPEWEPSPHPDLSRYTETGSRSIEDDWPWAPLEFHQMLADDAGSAIARLGSELPDDVERGWWGAGSMLERVVGEWPDDGFVIWDALARVEVRECVILGWSTAPLDESQMDRVAAVLSAGDLGGLAGPVARLLHPWTSDTALSRRWVHRGDGRGLARRAATMVDDTESLSGATDLHSAAINSAPGVLVDFWIDVAVDDARTGTYPGGGLSSEVVSALEDLLATHSRLARASLLRQLNFLYRADPAWTAMHLLATIDPNKLPWPQVEEAWGILLHGQFSEDLLQSGLREWIPVCARRVGQGSEITGDLMRLAAVVAVHSTMDDAERLSWLTALVANATTDAVVQWSAEVGELVEDLEPAARASLWGRWMKPYIALRVGGAPRLLEAPEITAMLGWLGGLDAAVNVREGVDLLLRTSVGISSETGSWRQVDVPPEALEVAPGEWARLLAGLLSATAHPLAPGVAHWASGAHTTLRALGADQVSMATIRSEFFRLTGNDLDERTA
ncbi:SIR2 family protein [Cellulomonas rhizosphaerae]|uniref:SIR2 family protein n=1 Tax=Cellulomonas rhizosphaerae TaxID=2293719 RepID=UPI00131402AF|nr:SIR2 family protein [Cellulomonas rhizosphaerae]